MLAFLIVGSWRKVESHVECNQSCLFFARWCFLRIVTGFMMTWGYCVVMTDELMRVLF